MEHNKSFIYVIFGASGDLAKRKLIPALYSLYVNNLLPNNFAIIGVSRTNYTDNEYRNKMREALGKFNETNNTAEIEAFTHKLFYKSLIYDNSKSYNQLALRMGILQREYNISTNTLYYLSTPPDLYGTIPQYLATAGLNDQTTGWKRIIIEKPFGYDLESALKLKDELLKDWKEEQLYRIDHYLGKETVQNLLVTRFSNGIFEPLWNNNFIHHVEVTSSESIGVEQRGGYYDNSGALRDMVQNHLLQVVALTAMEPPASLEPSSIRNEIYKVFQSLRPFSSDDVKTNTLRGQYTASTLKKEKALGYREEEGVNMQSTTETYAALKFYIDNWRWGGVPFYVRTGKRLPTRVTEVVIHFKPTPHFLFSNHANCSSCNQLVIRIQPDEGVLLKFGMKIPGSGFDVQNVNMDFHYSDLTNQRIPSAYERLIFDSIKGDTTLFARTEEIIAAWKFLSPVLDAWKNNPDIPLYGYPAGTWGPEKADDLIENKDMTWRYPCKNLSDDGIYCEL
ncbi:MAG: glucose-6-phosphate dehydrogenase [Bacteroidetes bacterium HGW-Bacteroidetes-4]|jgi:glucose-6-phosphate 1-dehydrogenase|nr:MAG: glucose-6-phosphate dehydrogenase [Bacteroidetes bacterium HGW-Bacteroidetes-4]